MKTTHLLYSSYALLGLLTACNTESNNSDSINLGLSKSYADLALENYSAAHDDAETLREEIKSFLNNPSTESLEKAKKAWLSARESYGQSEVFRFIDGPIDNENGPEGQINAWPLDEAHIDYVTGKENAGIINLVELFPTIDESTLIAANENPGEKDISTGYHAIEFLLWGQDSSAASSKIPGQRHYSDYTEAPNAERRATYLSILSDILTNDLATLVEAWSANKDNYRKNWISLNDDSTAVKMMRSMGSLAGAELSGERMAVALENADQEDEHSCFSDNTHRDIILNAQGIANLWLGSFGDFQTKGLKDYVQARNSELAANFQMKLDAALGAVQEIPAPFDYAISFENPEGRKKVEQAIAALREIPSALDEIATELNLNLVME